MTGRPAPDLEAVVRQRLRSLRQTLGWSLDDLAERSLIGASTISRIETGKRSLSLDVLVPLARALQADLDALLDVEDDEDVVIRPVRTNEGRRTIWNLSRPSDPARVIKMHLEPGEDTSDLRVHPGRDWFFVLEGRVQLLLGDREIIVETGEAADFNTMTPHAFAAFESVAEVIMVFDREGHQTHTHSDDS